MLQVKTHNDKSLFFFLRMTQNLEFQEKSSFSSHKHYFTIHKQTMKEMKGLIILLVELEPTTAGMCA